jgi:membrane protein implicated in regulation of membrane protease activity
MRVFIEVMHVMIGLVAAAVIGQVASWSYPLANRDIWLVTYAAMVAVVAMGARPTWRAWQADRRTLASAAQGGAATARREEAQSDD